MLQILYQTQKWIPAINRLKIIVKNYSETVFIEEALHRLVEVYYRVGLIEEAKLLHLYWVIIIIQVNGMIHLTKFK